MAGRRPPGWAEWIGPNNASASASLYCRRRSDRPATAIPYHRGRSRHDGPEKHTGRSRHTHFGRLASSMPILRSATCFQGVVLGAMDRRNHMPEQGLCRSTAHNVVPKSRRGPPSLESARSVGSEMVGSSKHALRWLRGACLRVPKSSLEQRATESKNIHSQSKALADQAERMAVPTF